MSFFEAPALPEAAVARAEVVSPPAWAGPPDNVVPAVVPAQLVPARTEQTAVAVSALRAYPTGILFALGVRLRHISDRERVRWRSSASGRGGASACRGPRSTASWSGRRPGGP